MLGTEMSKFRNTSQVEATMVDMPADPLACLPGAPLAAFQPETAWMPPDHVTPAPAAACSTLVHADWLVLQQTMIIQEMPAQPQALMAVTGRHVFSCSGSKACTPADWHCQWLWPVGVERDKAQCMVLTKL